MFSNHLIRSIATASDEEQLRLSPADWHRVLEANAGFTEEESKWRGGEAWARYLLNKAALRAEELSFRDSLELCCGNGFLFFSFREIFEFDDSARFIDLSRPQLDAFRRRCDEANIPQPQIIEGDIGQLPFADASLSLVYGNSFLHHLPDVGLYLREVRRVLRPGGQFIAFHEPNRSAPFLESFPRSLYKNVDLGSLTDIWLLRPSVIRNLAEDAGFVKVRLNGSGLLDGLLITPLQAVRAKLKQTSQSEVFARTRAALDRLERGVMPSRLRLKWAPSVSFIASV